MTIMTGVYHGVPPLRLPEPHQYEALPRAIVIGILIPKQSRPLPVHYSGLFGF